MSGQAASATLPVSHETLRGVVLRETPLKEQDKLLTVLTAEQGKVSLYAHGARAIKSRNLAATGLLCYSEFTCEKKGERRTLRESTLLCDFRGLREHLDAFAFAQYAAQVCADTAREEENEEGLLQLLLNTLYMTEKGEDVGKLKAAFELRYCAENGFLPDLSGCEGCGKEEGDFFLDTIGGTLLCPACAERMLAARAALKSDNAPPPSLLSLPEAALAAMRYVALSPAKRIFSFRLPPREQRQMSAVCERFLLDQIGHGYDSLRFYHEIALPANESEE